MKKLITQYGGLKSEIYILFIGRLVTAMGSFVWPMLTFLLTTKLGFSDGTATLLIATAGLVSLPVALLGGKLADKFQRKNVIIVFDILTVFMSLLAFLLPIGYHTAVLVFLYSLFQTLERPAYDALTADYSTTAQREKAFSLSYLGFNLGFVFGASLGGILFQNHTNLAFLINGLTIFVSTVLIFFFVKPENAIRENAQTAQSYGEYEKPLPESVSIMQVLRQRRAVLFVLLIGCLASMTNNTVGILLPLQLKEQMGQHGAGCLRLPQFPQWLRGDSLYPHSDHGAAEAHRNSQGHFGDGAVSVRHGAVYERQRPVAAVCGDVCIHPGGSGRGAGLQSLCLPPDSRLPPGAHRRTEQRDAVHRPVRHPVFHQLRAYGGGRKLPAAVDELHRLWHCNHCVVCPGVPHGSETVPKAVSRVIAPL